MSGVPDANTIVEYAVAADEAGWDGVFHIDHLIDFVARVPDEHQPLNDPWTTWAAVAAKTEHVILGSSITPIPDGSRGNLPRAWLRSTSSSDGRILLGAGLGGPKEFTPFGQEYDQRQLADQYDEALDIITGL